MKEHTLKIAELYAQAYQQNKSQSHILFEFEIQFVHAINSFIVNWNSSTDLILQNYTARP